MNIGESAERLRRSTVQIRSGDHGSGSGIVWDAAGVIVTNAHVATSADPTVEFWDGRTAKARLDKRDVRRDLAVLRVPSDKLEPAHPGDSGRLRVGEFVIAVGNPLGFIGALSTGVVHGLGRIQGIGRHDFIQTTARLAPGNSGGPLADSNGNVIGINTMVLSGGLGLAIPSNEVHRLLTSTPPIELGVTLRPVRIPAPDPGIALLVLGISPGSPAEYASLRIGDILIGFGGRRFRSIDDLRDALDNCGPLITLQFQRGDQRRREVAVRLSLATAA